MKPSDFLPITCSAPVRGSTVTAYAVSWPPNSHSRRVPSADHVGRRQPGEQERHLVVCQLAAPAAVRVDEPEVELRPVAVAGGLLPAGVGDLRRAPERVLARGRRLISGGGAPPAVGRDPRLSVGKSALRCSCASRGARRCRARRSRRRTCRVATVRVVPAVRSIRTRLLAAVERAGLGGDVAAVGRPREGAEAVRLEQQLRRRRRRPGSRAAPDRSWLLVGDVDDRRPVGRDVRRSRRWPAGGRRCRRRRRCRPTGWRCRARTRSRRWPAERRTGAASRTRRTRIARSYADAPQRRHARVLQHRHRRVAAVERDHAAARVGGGAAEVEAGDRRARRQPVLPHLVGRDLALEDVAAGQADALLDVGRPEHLVGLQPVLEAGREAVDQVDELARDLVAALVPGAVARARTARTGRRRSAGGGRAAPGVGS